MSDSLQPGSEAGREPEAVRQAGARRGGFGLALAGAAALLLSDGCTRSPAGDAGSGRSGRPGGGGGVPVLATQAVVKTMPVEIHAIGSVQAFSRVAVRSRITGELTRVHFQEGQEVKQGELLFTIDPRPPRAALNQAEANLARDRAQLENARQEYERQKKLVESKLISPDEFDKAEAALKALQGTVLADQAALTNAALNVEFTEIRAPIDGRAGSLLVHAGNIVQAGSDVLVTLNQLRPIYVAFAVPEQHLAEIKARLAERKLFVEANVPGLAPPPRGELTFVDNAVDASTGTIPLKAAFANTDHALWPGQFVAVVLRLEELAGAVVVPAPAVQSGQSGEFVYVVKDDQTVEMRTVRTGLTREGETVVERGLGPGETVVTDGQLRLAPGAKVSLKSGLAPTLAPAKARPAKGT